MNGRTPENQARAPLERHTERLKTTLGHLLGSDISDALDDPQVTEIMLNADGVLWLERGGDMEVCGRMQPMAARNVLNHVATTLETQVNAEQPILEGELVLRGERFIGTVPPLTTAPTFTIRKHAQSQLTLDDWQRQGGLTADQRDRLQAFIRERRNIVVSGGTGTGKTTLANALLNYKLAIQPTQRLVVIEDTRELRIDAENAVFMRTTPHIDMNRCLRASLRMRPDSIVVGEVRGGECLTLLKAWNTGHPGGICTIHATTAASARVRLEQMCAEAIGSIEQIRSAIEVGVDCIAQIERTATGERRVVELLETDAV